MSAPRAIRQVLTVLLAMLLVFGSLGAAGFITRAAAQTEMTKVEVVDQVAPAVVTVINLTTGPSLFGQGSAEPVEQGAGTGFIISEEGYIVTNWHVVEGGDAFQVTLSDGTALEAELIGTDPRDDLAIVRIDPTAVPAVVTFANSDEVKVGEEVLAIGSPLGLFSNTVTAGIVSGVGRNQLASDNPSMCMNYSNLIQHDAAINPGNSGGPLFNMQGQVIGVNTLGIPTTGEGQPIQGLFFAVPSNVVQTAVQEMIETGTVTTTTSYLGITYNELFPEFSSYYEIPVPYGALIRKVESGSPADQAGLQEADIIVAVNGVEVSAEQTFAGLMRSFQPNEQVTLTVLRDGETLDLQVTLGEREIDFSEQCVLETGQ